MPTRRACLGWLAAALTLGRSSFAPAQAWPARPVRIVVPFSAGGNADIIARIVAQRLAEAFGQQFVIENRAGASGAVAAETVARAPADGYTLLAANVPQIAVLPVIGRTVYDPLRDFAPITNIGINPFVLVAHPSMPVDTLAQFVEYVRERPNTITYVGSGSASLTYLTMALFRKRAGLDMIPVSYKGGAAPMADLLAGHVKTMFANVSMAMPHAASGALKLVAVTSERRVPQLPQVPTFAEAGVPNFTIVTWNGLMAPAGTPRDIIDRVAAEVAAPSRSKNSSSASPATGSSRSAARRKRLPPPSRPTWRSGRKRSGGRRTDDRRQATDDVVDVSSVLCHRSSGSSSCLSSARKAGATSSRASA